MTTLQTTSAWSLLIYRVSDDVQQQKILLAFHRTAWPGITVLGTQGGLDHFVIVDCDSAALERHARRIIVRIDSGATRMLRTKVPGGSTTPAT